MPAVEQDVLQALLAPLYDTRRSLHLPAHVTDALVLALARHHRLSPALSTIDSSISDGLRAAFDNDRLITLGKRTLLLRALVEIVAALGAAGIKVIVLKGLAYEEMAYPVLGTRPASDIDLLVQGAWRSPSFEIFRTLGFQPVGGQPGFDEPDYHEVALHRDDVNVDLHFALVPVARCKIDYDTLWECAQPLPIGGAATFALSRAHAVLHQALHMTVHHFDVPALYLLDIARLTSDTTIARDAAHAARAWRCSRAWDTSVAMTTAFIPAAREAFGSMADPANARAARLTASFGGLAPVSRLSQLRRKLEHFDNPTDAARYLAIQGRRIVSETLGNLGPRRSAAERFGW
jgi:hypothetical protein